MRDEPSATNDDRGDGAGAKDGWGAPRSRTITWYPLPLAGKPASPAGDSGPLTGDSLPLTGLGYLEAVIDGRLPPPPITAVCASELVAAANGSVELRFAPDESWLNPNGSVHGGLLCTLMDSAMGLAVTSTRESVLEQYTSIELKVSFLKPLPWDGQAITVRGRTLRVGRKVAFAEAHAELADGTLVGHATSSLAAIGRP